MLVRGDLHRWLLIVLFVAASSFLLPRSYAAAEPNFPPLTGRVVDQAHILSRATRAQLAQMLEQFERETKRQVVVATIESLQGTPIEDYGYQLGRRWGIGEKGQNTGAILIIAPTEREVRIEVGYGLEGELTDADARQILDQFILPHFRAGDIDAGVMNGTLAVLRALGWQGDPMPQTLRRPPQTTEESAASFFLPLIIFLLIFFVLGRRRGWRGGYYPGSVYRAGGPFRGGSLGGGGFGGGGGGFRGGGGSFGGGGASGRW